MKIGNPDLVRITYL